MTATRNGTGSVQFGSRQKPLTPSHRPASRLDLEDGSRVYPSVAHRLSTLTNFDRIIVICDGRICEDGTVEDLRRAGGMFDRMWRLQAEGLSQDAVMDPA